MVGASQWSERGLSQAGSGDKPAILQLVPALNEGGVERGALEIGEAILKAGGRALIATAGGKMESRFTAMGGEIVKMRIDRKGPLAMRLNAGKLKRLIRKEKIDIVHARSRAPAWAGYWATQATGTPFITTYHGAYNEGPPGKRKYNSVMAKGEPVIAVSDFIARMVAERHGTPPEKIVTIPRGADLGLFTRERVTSDRIGDLIESWQLAEEDRRIFILPGRLTRWKGQQVFIDACAILRERRGPVFLGLIVGGIGGNEEYLDQLDKQIVRTNTGDVIRMTGACSDMPAAYVLADCAVSASTDPEAFGRVAVEAQAMGLPVLASAHGGAMETVEHEETGLLVTPGDPEALADAMEQFLDLSKEDLAAGSPACRARVERMFSIERMQQATLDVYESVLGRPFPNRAG